MDNQNSFSMGSPQYAQFRPSYPDSLFGWISSQCASFDLAWDCATGNGQAAVGLATTFQRVVASDISAQQLEQAPANPRIEYRVFSAEQCELDANRVDAIVVAQALHWFNFDRFWSEVRRVAKPECFFCAWGYCWPKVEPELDHALIVPFRELLEPFWALNNRILWEGYPLEAIQFPFQPIKTPEFEIRLSWTVSQLICYLQTWSAYKRSLSDDQTRKKLGELLAEFDNPQNSGRVYDVSMPLTVLAAKTKLH